MPWPVLFYLPRPGPAPSALSAPQDIVIPLHASSRLELYVMCSLRRDQTESV
jgi:hypothetical protein